MWKEMMKIPSDTEEETGILYGLGGGEGLEVVSSYMLGVVIKLNRWLGSSGSSVSLNEMILYVKSSGYLVSDSCDRKEDRVLGKSKCIIPFCGSKISGRCSGIKLNYGLYIRIYLILYFRNISFSNQNYFRNP